MGGEKYTSLPIALSTHLSGAPGTLAQLLLLLFQAHSEPCTSESSLFFLCPQTAVVLSRNFDPPSLPSAQKPPYKAGCFWYLCIRLQQHRLPHTSAMAAIISSAYTAYTSTALFTVSRPSEPARLVKAGLHFTCRPPQRLYHCLPIHFRCSAHICRLYGTLKFSMYVAFHRKHPMILLVWVQHLPHSALCSLSGTLDL